jgi:hypothetical protein
MRGFLAVMAVGVLGVLLMAGPAAADAYNVRPVPFNSASLQNWFNGPRPSGIDAYLDQFPIAIYVPGSDLVATSTIRLALAGYNPNSTAAFVSSWSNVS